MNFRYSCSVLISMLLASCSVNQQNQNQVEITNHGDTITVAAQSPILQHITLEKIVLSPFQASFQTVGTVRAKAGMIAEVGVPMDGRTTQSFVQLGQQVSTGQALFGFQASESADMAKTYQQALASMTLAQKNLQRKQELMKNGLVSQREMEEVKHEAELAESELKQWEHTLKIMNMGHGTQAGGQMNISSPIAGEVVQLEITPGQFVKSDTPALATVANLKQVWIAARLKEYYVNAVHQQDSVSVQINSQEKRNFTGKIHYVGQLLDEETRSVEVLVECENPDRLLKPGMFAHVEFTTPKLPAIVIPATAVMQGEHFPYVYVQIGDRSFVQRKIEVESASNGMVHVLSGLQEGDKIVTQGAIYLSE